MKCPKCGYNSFDDLETCKKCGGDLTEHKTRYGLRSLFLTGREAANEVEPPAPAPASAAPLFAEELPFDFDAPDPAPAPESAAAQEDETAAPDAPADDSAEAAESFDATFEDWPLFTEENAERTPADEAEPKPAAQWSDAAPQFDATAGEWPLFADDEAAAEPNAAPAAEEAELPLAAEETLADWPLFDDEEEARDAVSASAGSDDDFAADLSAAGIDSVAASAEEATAEWSLFLDDEQNAATAVGEAFTEEDDPFIAAPAAADVAAPALPAEFDFSLPAEDETSSDESVAPSAVAEAPLAEEPEAVPTAVPSPPAEDQPRWEGVAAEESQFLRVPVDGPPPVFPRIAATAVDLVFLAVMFALFLWVGSETFLVGGVDHTPLIEAALALAVPYFLVLLGLCFGYFIFFHFLTGQTPGKMLFGLRVEGENGESILLSQAFLRSVGGLLALLCLGLGFVPVLKGNRRGWNDQLAGTRLVSTGRDAVGEA